MNRWIAGLTGVVTLLVCLGPLRAAQIGHWAFDDGLGTTATDALGLHPGVLRNGTAWTTDSKFGTHALSFDGSNDYVSVTIDVPETNTGVSLWLKTTADNRGVFAVVDADLGGGGHDRHLYLDNTGNLRTRIHATESISTTGLNLADGEWHHVVHTYGGAAGGQKLYIDGALEASGSKADSDFDWQQRINIGFSNDGANDWFQGNIDEVQYFDAALDATDVTNLYLFNTISPAFTDLEWTKGAHGNWNEDTSWSPGPAVPDAMTNASLNTDHTITVPSGVSGEVANLYVNDGKVAVAAGGSLSAVPGVQVASGAELHVSGTLNTHSLTNDGLQSLGPGGELIVGPGGGSIATLTTGGDATIDTAGDLVVSGSTYNDQGIAGTMTKRGAGTMSLDNWSGSGVIASDTTFRVEAGTLKAVGDAPLGGSPHLVLAGGTVEVGNSRLPGGAAAHYSFDDSGNPGYDDSGSGHQGSLQAGAAWTSGGAIGGGLALSGGNDKMLVDPVVDIGADWTISSWFNTLAPATTWRTLTRGASGHHQIIVHANGELGLHDGAWRTSGYSMTPIQNDPGAWHHVAAVGTSGHIDFYVDGDWVSEVNRGSTTDVYSIGNYQGNGQRFSDVIDEVLVYNRTLGLAEIQMLYDAGVAGGYGGPLDMTGTDVTVQADSTLRAIATSAAFGTLTLENGVLRTEGAQGGISFTDTAIAGATVGFDTQVNTLPGAVDGGGSGGSIVKLGPADLILDAAGTNLGGATFDVQEGRLIGVHGSNPFGEAGLRLSGGELVLASATVGASVTYDNSVTVSADSTITAGNGGVAAGGSATVTLAGMGNVVTVEADKTLTLRSTDNYTLDVAGQLNSGNVKITEGTVGLNGGGTVAKMEVAGGTAGTPGVGVSDRLQLGEDATFAIQPGHTFDVSGSDLLAGQDLTLSGGTLTVSGPPAKPTGAVGYWSFDDPGNLGHDDTGNGHNGTLLGDASSAGGRIGGALALDGNGDYVSVPDHADLRLTGDMTIAFWYQKTAEAGDWQRMVGKGDPTYRNYGVWDESGGGERLLWQLYGADVNMLSTVGVPVGAWAHAVALIEGNEARIYINGQERGTASKSGTPRTSAAPLTFGWGGPGLHTYLPGYLDEIFIYDYALDTDTIDWLYQAGLAGTYGGSEVNMPDTNVAVVADSAVHLRTATPATLGDLTLANNATLTLSADSAPSISFAGLSGDGTVTGDPGVIIRESLAPGAGVGILTVDTDLKLLHPDPPDRLVYEWELDSTATDLVEVTGNLDLADAFWALEILDAGLMRTIKPTDPLVLFTYGTFDGNLGDYDIVDATGLGYRFSTAGARIDYRDYPLGGGEVFLTGILAVVPEPSTLLIWSLLAALGIGCGWYRRRN